MTATAGTDVKAYRVHGTTDDVTTCDQCGREELKSTVIMIALDAEGNDMEAVYMGRDCASKASGWTQKYITRTAAIADRDRADRRVWATEVMAVYGPVENASVREKAELYYGRNPHMRHKGIKASVEIAKMLADARAALAA